MKTYCFPIRHLCCTVFSLMFFAATSGWADPGHESASDIPPYDDRGLRENSYGETNASYHPVGTIPGEPVDEAKSGYTLLGTPVTPRTPESFPAESRDLFWQMDWVPGGNGQLVPLNFDENGDGTVSDAERDGIRGRNTWLLWGGGNEAFWGWLQERAYGLTDFLILMDSRQRAQRFETAGMINQPGFETSTLPILGLYLDRPKDGDWRNGMLRPPPPRTGVGGQAVLASHEEYGYGQSESEVYDAQGRPLAQPVKRPNSPIPSSKLFEPWTTLKDWEKQNNGDGFKDYIPEVVRGKLPQDGVDTAIYGYPSGIFGLRLFLNPDFFAKTVKAAMARGYWKKQVENTNGRYYTDKSINADPNLVRPFRVTMSCGFCHVAQHPLNPPLNNEAPEWQNLSSIIGAQYLDPQAANAVLQKRMSFLYHFLKSQAPGTIDTSLVSTDHINNTNVINPIFDVPSRLTRALAKPPEEQSRTNLLLPSLEDPGTGQNPDGENKLRHFPTVLGPGEDSVGIFGALERVPHNVGVFPEMWFSTGNLVLGYTPQRPFSLEVGRKNSVYWNANVKYRVPYMAKFFELGFQGKVPKSTAAMKLKDASPRDADGKPLVTPLEGEKALAVDTDEMRTHGREIFLNNCAICHSSKLPDGFDLTFERKSPAVSGGWNAAPAPLVGKPPVYTLPMDYRDWESFRNSPAMADFRQRMKALAGEGPKTVKDEDPFLKDNFLSNELRIPITLVGTYAGRALATNAMRGNVWDNYSSETFKNLKSVGKIRYFNPYAENASTAKASGDGTNAEFDDGREKGGPGYFRPATLISIWASAPFFHNNALGIYTHDTSVQSRMLAFDDAIRKLLWNKQRTEYTRTNFTYLPPGDLRAEGSPVAANDPGYIYRLPVDARIQFQAGFTPLIIKGLLNGFVGHSMGGVVFTILSFWWWVLLAALFLFLIFKGRLRHLGALILLLGLLIAAAAGLLTLGIKIWLVAVVLFAIGLFLMLNRNELHFLTRGFFIGALLLTLFAGILTNKFLNGRLKQVNLFAAVLPNSWLNADYQGIDIGPIPRGTPVNLLMSLDPDLKKIDKVAPAVIGLVRAMIEINRENLTGEEAYKVLEAKAGQALMAASKCPDFVLDRGHWFGETLNDDPKTDAVAWEKQNDKMKEDLIAFLKTL